MIFSRDAVASKIQSLGASSSERAQLLLVVVLANLALGIAFLIATLFTSSTWGTAIAFQATSTAVAHLGIAFAILQWFKQPDVQKLDLFGGAFLMLLLMLFQTTLAWGNLSGGFVGVTMPAVCFVGGSSGDKATSILSGLLLLTNTAFGILAYTWRGDWINTSSSLHYSNLSGASENQGRSQDPVSDTRASLSSAVHKSAFVDEDVEGGL